MYKVGQTSGDCNREIISTNFKKWISEIVMPNLKPASVIVMDSAPYHL
jgi:hypothetical protein